MEPIDNEAAVTDRGLCELKTGGFIRIIERVLDRAVPSADPGGTRRYEGNPYAIEKQGEGLTVWSAGEIVLRMERGQPSINRLTPRDLFNIVRMETRLTGNMR